MRVCVCRCVGVCILVQGQIATKPLIEVIRLYYPQYKYIGVFVDIFISVSISCSFLTVGLGYVHVLDGFVRSWQTAVVPRWCGGGGSGLAHAVAAALDRCLPLPWRRALLYLVNFTFIYLMAATNPRSFLLIIERLTSLVLNLEAGMFIVLMLYRSRLDHAQVKIPFELPKPLFHFAATVMVYYMTAVVYDVLLTTTELFIRTTDD